MENNAPPRHAGRPHDSPPTPVEWLVRDERPSIPPPPKKAHLRCLADLPEQPLQWLWPGRIPRGALTLLCGDPGRGKSLLTMDFAARVTTGQPWPDGASPDEPADVLLLSGEDSIGRTVRSRLLAHGADIRRVFYLNSGMWLEPNEPLVPPLEKHGIIGCSIFGDVPVRLTRAFWQDAQQIKPALEALPECRLVVIDPMPAYFQVGPIHEPEQARQFLTPLTAFADRTGAAVIAVVHRDQAMQRTSDRRFYPIRAVADLARAVYLVDRRPEFPGAYAMLPVKNNLGDAQSAMTFSITGAPGEAARIQWNREPLQLADAELAHRPSSTQSRSPRLLEIDRATAWLAGALAAGPVSSRELADRARKAGLNDRMFDRARAKLGVQAYKEPNFEGRWTCALPAPPSRNPEERQETDEGRQTIDLSSLSSFAQPANP